MREVQFLLMGVLLYARPRAFYRVAPRKAVDFRSLGRLQEPGHPGFVGLWISGPNTPAAIPRSFYPHTGEF